MNTTLPDPLRVAAQLAYDALLAMAKDGWLLHGAEGMSDEQKLCADAIRALCAAFADAPAPRLVPTVSEPVAWVVTHTGDFSDSVRFSKADADILWLALEKKCHRPERVVLPLYTRPAQPKVNWRELVTWWEQGAKSWDALQGIVLLMTLDAMHGALQLANATPVQDSANALDK